MTLGWLYDFYESRLIRDCAIQTTFFTSGGSAINDPHASPQELRWETQPEATKRGFSLAVPRIAIRSTQIWPGGGPSRYQHFDVQAQAWDIRDELPFTPATEMEARKWNVYEGNGFQWLVLDCQRDDDEVGNARWSRSEGFERVRLRGVASGMSRGQ